jgi:CheY-like chemotaxis protein
MNSTPPPLPSEKILIVDDDPVVVKALSLRLTSKGFAVCSAADGPEAVKSVREQKPKLILLDINLPQDMGVAWDGFRIIEWLRHMDEARNIPILVISGGAADKFQSRALAAGAAGYFQKPVDHELLFATIRKTLANPPPPLPEAPPPMVDKALGKDAVPKPKAPNTDVGEKI